MKYETIEYQVPEKGLGLLSLNRPRRYNAVNYRMMEELEHFWRARRLDLDTRVVDGSELRADVLEMAGAINSKNPMGLRLTKEAINMSLDAGGLEQALNMEDRNQALLVARSMLGKSEKSSKYF